MDQDLCDLLAYEARADYRILVLTRLLWGDPLAWRLRRTDTFRDRDGESFDLAVRVDSRIRKPVLLDELGNLLDLYRQAPALLERADVGVVRRQIARAIDAAEAANDGAGAWDSADIVVPVGWVYGPPAQLVVRVNGSAQPVLSRRETAELVSRTIMMMMLDYKRTFGALPSAVDNFERLRLFYWLVAARDSFSSQDQVLGRKLGRARKVEQRVRLARAWFDRVSGRAGFSLSEEHLDRQLRRLVGAVQQTAERHLHDDEEGAAWASPLWNPLLLLPAFVQRCSEQSSLRDRTALAESVEREFFSVAADCLRLVDRLVTTADTGVGSEAVAAAVLIDAAQRLSWFWPLLARCEVRVDQTSVMEYELVARAAGGSRGRWRAFDLGLGDARSYHAEVVAPHPELVLAKRRAQVAVMRAGRPAHKSSAADFFSRTVEDNGRLQTFYHADAEMGVSLVDAEPAGPIQVVLRVRQKVFSVVLVTNWAFAVGLFGASLYLCVLATADAMAASTGTASFWEAWKTLLPAYIGVLLLFTLERHGNPTVARRLSAPWLLSLFGFGIAVAAIISRAVVFDEHALPWVIVFELVGRR